MGVPGATAVASALQRIPRLSYLSLDSNSAIGDAGAIALAAGLHHVPQLGMLFMQSCGLSTGWFSSKPGISALKDAVKRSCPRCALHNEQ